MFFSQEVWHHQKSSHIQTSFEIYERYYPSQMHDTTLISTVLLPSGADRSHTQTDLHSSLILLDSHVVSTANLTTPDGERVIEYVKENVCDSDWSIYWVIALGFVSLHISGWVYLALKSSTITEDDWK